MDIFIVSCAVLGYIRPKSVLVVCCGLLAKWLRVWVWVRVRVRVRAGARECTTCSFLYLSGLISVVTPWFGSLRKYVVVYLWFHVTWLVTSVLRIE